MKVKSDKSGGKTGNRQRRIAVIGIRGSGKTTLAAGLFASSSDRFTVGAADDTTRSYLAGIKSELQNGDWPAPTQMAGRKEIRILINEGKGKVTPVTFTDYMGELVVEDRNFLDEYVKSPDGALLLFNPGMDSLSDAQKRNRMISFYRESIDHLKKQGCRHVAFVVTAADRLEGDLKDKTDLIEGYEKEITDYLESVGGPGWWKRILVTVTGKLESQDKAALAAGDGNSSKEPFKYLIEQLDRDEACSRFKKVSTRIGFAVLAVAIAAAAYVGYMYVDERNWLDASIKAAAGFTPSSAGGVAKAKELKDDMDGRYAQLCARKPVFGGNLDKWVATTNEWATLREKLTYDYLACQIADLVSCAAKDGTEANMIRIEHDIGKFAPVNSPGLLEDLKSMWKEERAKIRAVFDNESAKNFRQKWRSFQTGAESNASEKAIDEFAADLNDWQPVAADMETTRSNLLARLPDEAPSWRVRYEIHRLDASCASDRLAANDVFALFRSTLSVPSRKGSRCDNTGKMAKDISDARKRLLVACANSFAAKEWNPNGDDSSPSGWKVASMASWDPAGVAAKYLKEDERDCFIGLLESHRKKSEEAWVSRQNTLSRDFIARIGDMSAVDACTEYGAFCSDHPMNPGICATNGLVRATFLEKVRKEFTRYKEHYTQEFCSSNRIYATTGDRERRVEDAERRFSEFSSLCQLLPGNAGTTLKDTAVYKFAKEASPEFRKGMKDAFTQRLTITKSEISFASTKLGTRGWHTGFKVSIKVVGRNGMKETENSLLSDVRHYGKSTILSDKWIPRYDNRNVIAFNAWTEPVLHVDIEDCCGGSNGKCSTEFQLKDFVGGEHVFEAPVEFNYGERANSTVLRLRVSGKLDGLGFLDLWNRCFGK